MTCGTIEICHTEILRPRVARACDPRQLAAGQRLLDEAQLTCCGSLPRPPLRMALLRSSYAPALPSLAFVAGRATVRGAALALAAAVVLACSPLLVLCAMLCSPPLLVMLLVRSQSMLIVADPR